MRDAARMMDSLWVMVDGLPVHALVKLDLAPVGTPVVLVAGLIVASRSVAPTALALAPHFPAYAPDLPGFGRSGKPRRVLDVGELAESLRAWMDAVPIERASFLANSFGTQVTTELALRYPERVERVVLHAPVVDPTARTARQQIVRWLRDLRFEIPELIPILVRDAFAAGIRRDIGTFQSMMRYPIEERLAELRVPVLVARGTVDAIVPQDWAERATGLITGAVLSVLADAPHTATYQSADVLSGAVLPFLQEARSYVDQGGQRPRRPSIPRPSDDVMR